KGQDIVSLKAKQNYLSLTGYRLPTEAEMEYACRAGAVTSRYYGAGDELLEKYGWYLKNSQECSWPPGLLKPNDLGLFDMPGNLWGWCQDAYREYPPAQSGQRLNVIEDIQSVSTQSIRSLRGGSFNYTPVNIRCARRMGFALANRDYSIGFRPARTLR